MDPSQKGWLKQFLNYRTRLFIKSKEFEKTRQGQHPDQSFYGLVQPTGIMYGYPVHFYDMDTDANWSPADAVKVLMADSFINIAELYNEAPVNDEHEFQDLMYKTMKSVNDFYQGVYPEITLPTANWLRKKRDVLSVTEKALHKRIQITLKKKYNFWTEFFNHTQLFLDIYIFGQWSHTEPDKVLLDFFKEEKEELGYTVVKVMAAAAHANKQVETEEKQLFEHFIDNSGLSSERKRVANEYFEHGAGIQDIPVSHNDPWVIRKFFLELAILTVWSDKKMESIEWTFLSSFNQSLGFSGEDFDNSMIAVEGFALENWHHLDSLREKKDPDEIGHDYIARMSKVVQKYENRIKLAILNDKSLTDKLYKGKSTTLTEDDKEEIRLKFLSILKAIPSFRIIALPKHFLSFEILLRVIPKTVISEILNE